MLDMNFIRENSQVVRDDLRKRQDPAKEKMLNELLELDVKWREEKKEIDKLRQRRNELSLAINKAKKDGKDADDLIKEAKALPDTIKAQEDVVDVLKDKIHFILMRLPNVLHGSVPVGEDENDNVVVKEWGERRKADFDLKPHGELIQQRKLGDFDKAAEVSGNGFYYLFGDLALMELAIQRFAIDILVKKGYTIAQPPYMLRREPYEGVTDLADFETMMYKIDGEDLYLIATSEHSIGAYFMGEVLPEDQLPVKFAGVSACFRKEIGSSGIDTKGLFRVHQFNKIEQFIFCKPEDSWKLHEELIANAEEIFQKLGLPYRVVSICTGDIGIVAAKKYDLEVWMPREDRYREAVSCSNCTGYQATRLNIRYQKGKDREFIHTLNSTAIATGRALRAIIETYQNKDGTITVPNALVPYMNGKKVI